MKFGFPSELWYSAAMSLAFPLILLVVSRIGALRGRNAARFLAATLAQLLLWVSGCLLLPREFRPVHYTDWILAAMILASVLLVYLEIWALLSRGYTLSMVITLRRAGGSLTTREIAERYRGGAGLDWIMRHRTGGLEAARLVCRNGEDLVLTVPLGQLTALAYKVAIALFGLRRTG